jgi:hypothetical protein
MKIGARQRWLVLVGLLTAALTAAAWVRDSGSPEAEAVVEAPARGERPVRATTAPTPTDRVALEKLRKHALDANQADPFAPRSWSKPVPRRAVAAVETVPAPPPLPTAPPLPFVYLGRISGDEANAVFLAQGERNLVVRLGDEIDSTYRLERLGEGSLTLTHLPTGIRQTLAIGEAQ